MEKKISTYGHNNEEMAKWDQSFCTDLFERQTLAFAGGMASLLKQIKLMSCKTISTEIYL